MERVQRLPKTMPLTGTGRPDLPALATWALGAAIVGYLLLQNGGYDPIVRDEVGLATWVIAICGIAVGAFPAPTSTRYRCSTWHLRRRSGPGSAGRRC